MIKLYQAITAIIATRPKMNKRGIIITRENCKSPSKSGNQNGAVSNKKTIAANSTMKSNTSLY